jgi:universal stress protein A
MNIQRILVATDFGPDSEAALNYALEFAKALQASVDVLHVVETPLAAGMWASEIYTAEIAGLQMNLVRDAGEHLGRTIADLSEPHVVVTGEVRTGRAATTIHEYALERGSDLIVMGTRGRTGVARMVMGSVAEGVTREAPCPVLVVRPRRLDTFRATAHARTESVPA